MMYCLICEPLVELVETVSDEDHGMFYQYYECPNCGQRHMCSSQSGDMIQEYLDMY